MSNEIDCSIASPKQLKPNKQHHIYTLSHNQECENLLGHLAANGIQPSFHA